MNIRVTIEGHSYLVDVGDTDVRPVIATVDGERFEVWPEEVPVENSQSAVEARRDAVAPAPQRAVTGNGLGAGIVRAPIPGTVVKVAVQPGQVVLIGQELCVIEAMKMQNSIRAPRAGTIGKVHIVPGQHVGHHDILIEYR
jgi:propionyl-CoA carboxylase alpha chain